MEADHPSEAMSYKDTLRLYYEEEIMGEAYFGALASHSSDKLAQEKLHLLAQVEQHAAGAVEPLLRKYALTTRTKSELFELGRRDAEAHTSWDWAQFITHITQHYPNYLEQFANLESMAPERDLPVLRFLTEHETVTIEFAKAEQAGDSNAVAPLTRYLAATPPLIGA